MPDVAGSKRAVVSARESGRDKALRLKRDAQTDEGRDRKENRRRSCGWRHVRLKGSETGSVPQERSPMPGCPCNIRALHALKIRGATERTHASHRFAAGTGAENSAKSVGDDANPRHQGGASPFLLVRKRPWKMRRGRKTAALATRSPTAERRSCIQPPRRQFHGLILRNGAQHRVSKDDPARNVVTAPNGSVLRDAALRAAPQDEGGLGVAAGTKWRRKPLKQIFRAPKWLSPFPAQGGVGEVRFSLVRAMDRSPAPLASGYRRVASRTRRRSGPDQGLPKVSSKA